MRFQIFRWDANGVSFPARKAGSRSSRRDHRKPMPRSAPQNYQMEMSKPRPQIGDPYRDQGVSTYSIWLCRHAHAGMHIDIDLSEG